jgi:Mg2+ and Co2+ transporter CorA
LLNIRTVTTSSQDSSSRHWLIRTAQITEVKNADAERTALSDSLSAYNALLNQEQNAMVQARTAIYTANDEMTQIKGFHFGRPHSFHSDGV